MHKLFAIFLFMMQLSGFGQSTTYRKRQFDAKSFLRGIALASGFSQHLFQKQFADFNKPSGAANLLGETYKKANYYSKSPGLIFGVTL